MKKKLLFTTLLTLLFILGASASALQAQCTPNPPSNNPGFYPDPAPTGCKNQPYNEVIQFVFPLDTTVSGFTIPFDSFAVTSFSNVPAGITINQSSANGFYYPVSATVPARGCADLFGTPTVAAAGLVTVNVTAYVTVFGNVQSVATTFDLTFDVDDSPSASYTYSANLNAVTFTNTSTVTGSPTYSWDFGDGSTSTMASPGTHTYPAGSGLYNCCLIVDNGNCADTSCQNITVGCPPPAVAFSSSVNQLSVAFTDNTPGTPTSWLWNFGDASTSTLQNPTHTYLAAGNYTVCLTVSDACGTDSSCTTVSACNLPTSGFTAASTELALTCTDASTSGGTITAWAWDFGDGIGTSTLQNPTYTYAAPGSYQICLIVTDGCGSDTSCVTETITCVPGTADFTWSAANLNVTFTNTSVSTNNPTYSWDFGDGSPASTQMSPSHTFVADGTYEVCLTLTDACGTNQFCDSLMLQTIGFEESFLSSGLELFPNPANQSVSVRLTPKQALQAELRVMNLMGKSLQSYDLGTISGTFERTLDLGPLSPGMYLVQLVTDQGSVSLRLVKE